MNFRNSLAASQGFSASSMLRLIGHSAGTLTSQAMLADLVDRGVLSEREDSLFSRVSYWAIDGPWRGVDLPWIFQLLMLKFLGPLVTLPPVRLDRGAQSVINRLGPLMTTVTRDLGLPRSVLNTRHIFATGMQDLGPSLRHYEPVSSFLCEELGEGEGQDLYRFLRKHKTLEAMRANRNDLDSFSPSKLTRRKGFQNLVLIMTRDYPELIGDLQKLAEDSSAVEFGTVFNPTVKRRIRTYEGQHTEFMWTNPQFMMDIRDQLKDVWTRLLLFPEVRRGPVITWARWAELRARDARMCDRPTARPIHTLRPRLFARPCWCSGRTGGSCCSKSPALSCAPA